MKIGPIYLERRKAFINPGWLFCLCWYLPPQDRFIGYGAPRYDTARSIGLWFGMISWRF